MSKVMLLIAIHEIIRMGAGDDREVIRPGECFTPANADEVDFFLGCGAAEEAPEGSSPVNAAPVEPRDLTKMKKPELVGIAEELGIEAAASLTVAQLIEAIAAAETAQDDPV